MSKAERPGIFLEEVYSFEEFTADDLVESLYWDEVIPGEDHEELRRDIEDLDGFSFKADLSDLYRFYLDASPKRSEYEISVSVYRKQGIWKPGEVEEVREGLSGMLGRN